MQDIGSTLKDFKAFTGAFPPEVWHFPFNACFDNLTPCCAQIRGESLGASDPIRKAHNSFARAEPFMSDEVPSEDGEAFHFVAYIPHGGRVYELDGLKQGPVDVGQTAVGSAWWGTAASEIQRRIAQYGATELRFALMGVCQSKRASIRAQMHLAEARVQAVLSAEGTAASAAGDDAELGDFKVVAEPSARPQQLAELEATLQRLRTESSEDDEKRAAWDRENTRRQHNYVPLAMALFNIMADKQLLLLQYEQAKEKRDEAIKRAADRRATRKAQAKTAAVTP
jgi:ubiquitin carboxyl-terminal hydrolase L5